MNEEFLKSLKLEETVIAQILTQHQKDVDAEKTKFSDYEDVKKQLQAANETIEKFKDYEQTKADVEKYKREAEEAKKLSAEKIALLELQAKIKDFTGQKRFVNDFTRNSINDLLEKQLNSQEAKGKSLDDLFFEITKDKTNILADENIPTPPKATAMAGGQSGKNTDADNHKYDAIMGLSTKM